MWSKMLMMLAKLTFRSHWIKTANLYHSDILVYMLPLYLSCPTLNHRIRDYSTGVSVCPFHNITLTISFAGVIITFYCASYKSSQHRYSQARTVACAAIIACRTMAICCRTVIKVSWKCKLKWHITQAVIMCTL